MQRETHTITVFISGALSRDSEKPHGCVGHVLVQLPFREVQLEALNFTKSFAALSSQPPSFLSSILDYPIMHCSLKGTLAVRPAMCSFISTDPLLCCDSKSALFAAVPLRHFLTTCGLPVLRH
jgi:hypothetical protein